VTHGLRKAAATRAAERGATEAELEAKNAELPTALPDAVRQQLTEVNRALAQAHTALMRLPEAWWPCDAVFLDDLARVRNRSANERATAKRS
jgi:hypothetical protein